MSAPVYVVIVAEAITSQLDAVKTILSELARASRAELGCQYYEILTDNAKPHRLTIIETWDNTMSLARHRQSAHVAKALSALDGKLASAPQIDELSRLG